VNRGSSWQGTVFEGMSKLPNPEGKPFIELFKHGSWSIEMYAPRGTDGQHPHEQDEVYVVASGEGAFVAGDDRYAFGPGDALFVPAGVAHHFEDFSDDLAVWVIFGGPMGGEKTGAPAEG
jgi:mannose-6-phosphate isomerase-like protein (cupin superfamily)